MPGSIGLAFRPDRRGFVFTDMVPHAVLGGRLAFEQTVIVPRDSLENPLRAPSAILEKIAGRQLTI